VIICFLTPLVLLPPGTVRGTWGEPTGSTGDVELPFVTILRKLRNIGNTSISKQIKDL